MRARELIGTTWTVDLDPLRYAGGAMLILGVGLPLLPHNPGLPCPLRTLTGVPCPFCGLTTSVKATLATHVGAAVSANPFGLIAVLLAIALVVRPRWRHARLPAALLIACLVMSWTWELHRFGFV